MIMYLVYWNKACYTLNPKLILYLTTATGGSMFCFKLLNMRFWPILAIVSQIYAPFGVLSQV